MTFLPLIAFTALGLVVAQPALAAPVLPTFNRANFSGNPAITNTYFPVIQGQERTYYGAPADEKYILTGLGNGPVILGVKTLTVRDRSYEGNRIAEDTFDYYSQDRTGNVWYLGEDVTNYVYDSAGNLISTNNASSWRAGVHGALPGYIMPTDRRIGFNYYQEHAPADQALDEGTTYAFLSTFSTSTTTYRNVLQVLETTALDSQARGFKYYAPRIGLIYEAEGLRPNFKNPQQTFELITIGTASNQSNSPLTANPLVKWKTDRDK